MKTMLNKMTVPALCSLAVCGFALGSSLSAADCSSGSSGGVVPIGFVQIERIARPAVNEGLVTSNAFLNSFNGITPAEDISVLTDPANATFFNEIVANTQRVDALDGTDDVVDGDIVQAFVPDVMRYDSTQSIAVGVGAYANAAVAVGTVVRPISGRKLEDDVIDITLSVINGNAVADNVGYEGVVGNSAQPGHQRLNGQAAALGAATFPFLAPAN